MNAHEAKPQRWMSLSTKFGIRLIVFGLMLTIISVSIQMYLELREELDHVDSRFKIIENSYLETLSKSMYYYDFSQLDLIMQGIINLDDIEYITVTDLTSKVQNVYEKGDPDAPRNDVRYYPLYADIEQKEVIAELCISASYKRIITRMIKEASGDMLLNFITIVVLTLFIIYTFKVLVTRHLHIMSEFANRFDLNKLGEQIQLKRSSKKPYDEIDNVVATFNDLIVRLANDIEHLKITEKELKQVNEDLEEMVYISSHDLQVPIISIEGFASEILENYKDTLDEDGIFCLKRMKINAERMHKLVLSLLDMSRLNTKKYPYQWFSLNHSINEIYADLSIAFEKNNGTLNIEEMPEIYGDKIRIEGIFRNVIANALKYEGKNITIDFLNACIRIKDDGIGIPDNQLERVFRPGERLKMKKIEGVGMGLTYCRKVCKNHNAKIWIERNREDSGVTVYLKFPEEWIRQEALDA